MLCYSTSKIFMQKWFQIQINTVCNSIHRAAKSERSIFIFYAKDKGEPHTKEKVRLSFICIPSIVIHCRTHLLSKQLIVDPIVLSYRVVGHLRSTRLNSEFIFCSVCSVSTFSAVLDSLEHADSGKNCR